MRRTMSVMAVAALGSMAAGAGAQDLAARVRAAGDGTVRFAYAADEGVCGNGRGNISIQREGRTGQVRQADGEWSDECEPGPVRVALDVSRGRVTALRAYVGGTWRGRAGADLGEVPAREASAFLLGLVESGPGEVAKEAIFPLVIAAGPEPWERLLAVARDEGRPQELRSSAVFWVGQGAADSATAGLQELVDTDGDREVREAAIFAISQRPKDESVPALIRIARTQRDPRLRRTAVFWLGQSRDPRALAYFEDVLFGK